VQVNVELQRIIERVWGEDVTAYEVYRDWSLQIPGGEPLAGWLKRRIEAAGIPVRDADGQYVTEEMPAALRHEAALGALAAAVANNGEWWVSVGNILVCYDAEVGHYGLRASNQYGTEVDTRWVLEETTTFERMVELLEEELRQYE
jgi:hypothetical protein